MGHSLVLRCGIRGRGHLGLALSELSASNRSIFKNMKGKHLLIKTQNDPQRVRRQAHWVRGWESESDGTAGDRGRAVNENAAVGDQDEARREGGAGNEQVNSCLNRVSTGGKRCGFTTDQ